MTVVYTCYWIGCYIKISISANKYVEHINKFKEDILKRSDATLGLGKEDDKSKVDGDDANQTKDANDNEKTECMFPCLMAMCGSASGIIKVKSSR